MFVLGTAGHIDHGKSSLIQALTGIDPDRLPEEKQRGMTIDLGFAWMKLPDGNEIGLVDVPGHERFVRNMVAGAGGINAAVLVIAADDGWMPQTREHLDILNLLDIKFGFVALTKIDLVEPDWIEMVMADVESKLQGSFLAGAPIIPCSSETGEGVDSVQQAIADIAGRLQSAEDIGKPRLFIDRAFLLTGIGVVITGTSRGGGFAADSDVYHFPSDRRLRIRSLQSHERQVTGVGPGTRVAINLTGADREEVTRGDVICGFPYLLKPRFVAVEITCLPDAPVILREGRRVLLIHGTTETEAVVRPFCETGLKPGETGLAIIKTDLPLAAFLMDNFILRLPTPQVTIGGGKILDFLDMYPKRKALPAMNGYLAARLSGDLTDILRSEVAKRLFTPSATLLAYSGFSSDVIDTARGNLIETGTLIEFDGYLTEADRIKNLSADLGKTLEKTHKNKSYLKGLTAEELARRSRVALDADFVMLLKYLEASQIIGRTQQFYHLPGFVPALDEETKREADAIMQAISKAGHNYLTFDDIEVRFKGSRKTLNFLRDDGRLKAVGTQFVMDAATWKQLLDFMDDKLNQNNRFTLAELRDAFSTTRKYALPLLEYFDQLKITRRDGDFRVKGPNYDERHSL